MRRNGENMFKVGDKAKHAVHGTVEITYGPYGDYPQSYVVRSAGVREGAVTETALTPIQDPFKVGDTVADNQGGVHTVAAGPFDRGSAIWYALSNSYGTVHPVDDSGLTLVACANTYEYEGVVYYLDATYRDCEGDDWTFTGVHNATGPLMACGGELGYSTIQRLLETYGPLVKVIS